MNNKRLKKQNTVKIAFYNKPGAKNMQNFSFSQIDRYYRFYIKSAKYLPGIGQ